MRLAAGLADVGVLVDDTGSFLWRRGFAGPQPLEPAAASFRFLLVDDAALTSAHGTVVGGLGFAFCICLVQ